jgi:hypothetical protein
VYALRAAFAGTDSSSMPLVKLIPRVDVINTFRVFAGHFECFRVVSRSQIQRFRSSARFLKGGSIPGSSTEGPQRCGPSSLAVCMTTALPG